MRAEAGDSSDDEYIYASDDECGWGDEDDDFDEAEDTEVFSDVLDILHGLSIADSTESAVPPAHAMSAEQVAQWRGQLVNLTKIRNLYIRRAGTRSVQGNGAGCNRDCWAAKGQVEAVVSGHNPSDSSSTALR